jgi:hypothetical protein
MTNVDCIDVCLGSGRNGSSKTGLAAQSLSLAYIPQPHCLQEMCRVSQEAPTEGDMHEKPLNHRSSERAIPEHDRLTPDARRPRCCCNTLLRPLRLFGVRAVLRPGRVSGFARAYFLADMTRYDSAAHARPMFSVDETTAEAIRKRRTVRDGRAPTAFPWDHRQRERPVVRAGDCGFGSRYLPAPEAVGAGGFKSSFNGAMVAFTRTSSPPSTDCSDMPYQIIDAVMAPAIQGQSA